jgi:hypothetical protein
MVISQQLFIDSKRRQVRLATKLKRTRLQAILRLMPTKREMPVMTHVILAELLASGLMQPHGSTAEWFAPSTGHRCQVVSFIVQFQSVQMM